MIWFFVVFFSLVGIYLIIQILGNIRLIGGNEMGIVSGGFRRRGFRTFSGGRTFILPLFQRFAKIDLTPSIIEVVAESAIAAGIVPLDVKASVSFAIAGAEIFRNRAATRILDPAKYRDTLERMAADIIEGHLRDAVADLTPEQVMVDKDGLSGKILQACQSDLADLGLEINVLNIADVDDPHLPVSSDGEPYIHLLKRIQAADAETQARRARAEAKAASEEQSLARSAETEVKKLQNERESLQAEIRLRLAQEDHRRGVEVERASSAAKARLAGIHAELEAEKANLELVKNRGSAEIIIPAKGRGEELVLLAKTEVAEWQAKADAELGQLEIALKTLRAAGPKAERAWLLENIDALFAPFAATLANYPVEHLSVVTGSVGGRPPFAVLKPDAVSAARDNLVASVLGGEETKPAGDVGGGA